MQCITEARSPEDRTNALLAYQSNLTPTLAIEQPNQISYYHQQDPMTLQMLLSLLVKSLADSINVSQTMNAFQIAECAALIAEEYWFLRPEEILYAIKQVKKGRYGKSFNRLDSMTILEWLRVYDTEERMQLIEERNRRQQAQLRQQNEDVDMLALYEKARQQQSLPPSQFHQRLEAQAKEVRIQEFSAQYWENRKAEREKQQREASDDQQMYYESRQKAG